MVFSLNFSIPHSIQSPPPQTVTVRPTLALTPRAGATAAGAEGVWYSAAGREPARTRPHPPTLHPHPTHNVSTHMYPRISAPHCPRRRCARSPSPPGSGLCPAVTAPGPRACSATAQLCVSRLFGLFSVLSRLSLFFFRCARSFALPFTLLMSRPLATHAYPPTRSSSAPGSCHLPSTPSGRTVRSGT